MPGRLILISMDKTIRGYISPCLAEKHTKEEKPALLLGSFSHGAYLEIDEKEILLLCDEKYKEIPFGIGIDDYAYVLGPDHIDGESKISFSTEWIRIANSEAMIEIKLQKRCVEERIGKRFDTQEFIDTATRMLRFHRKGVFGSLIDDSFPETEWSGRIRTFLQRNSLKAASNDMEGILLQLIGLGPGLTPSGDDFLCGYLYYKLHTGKTEDCLVMMDLIRQMMYQRTNRISCVYLEHVMNEDVFSLFEDIIRSENQEELKEAVNLLTEMGSNSGGDVLCGMIYAAMETLTDRQ